MRTFLILLAILTAQVTGKEDKVTFWEEARRRGASVTYTYGNRCVNFSNEWINRASSIDPYGKCVRLYSKANCEGDSRLVHNGSYMQFLLNMENRVASFRKCDSSDVRITLDERPRYYLMLYDRKDFLGSSHVVETMSGECKTLPPEWRNRVSSTMTLDQCYVFYDEIGCKGRKKYLTPFASPADDLQQMNFDKVVESVQPCDLRFEAPSTDKFIYKGSFEYTFWRYFFSIYSRAFRNQFDERAQRSTDGFISWNFLFAANTSASSIGHQYQDVFENVFVLLRYLMVSRLGKLGFNTENIETLADLALPVYNERMSQKKERVKNLAGKDQWSDHNYAVLIQMETEWYWLKWYFGAIASDWSPENSNDICGLVEAQNLHSTVPLVSDGYVENYGDDPWHAAIYRIVTADREPLLICGASIISSTVLVSAAHCFYNEQLKKALNNTSEYEIYVGKYTRKYSTHDGDSQKVYKIRELIFSPNGYNPTLTKTYGSDIILIILENPLQFDKYVRPVCLDWSGSVFGDSSPLDKQIGRVVGWGVTTGDRTTDTSKASEYLLIAELPFISYSQCLGKVEHITSDKFCGGADTGPAVRRGDSGGGFVFKYVNRYYIRGIVSTRDVESKSSVNTFTDISFYITWIRQHV